MSGLTGSFGLALALAVALPWALAPEYGDVEAGPGDVDAPYAGAGADAGVAAVFEAGGAAAPESAGCVQIASGFAALVLT